MIGKKNIVFGFLFLVLTAALGPLMSIEDDKLSVARMDKQEALEKLEQTVAEKPGGTLELITDKKTDVNSEAIQAMNYLFDAESERNKIKSGPHAHGNLEALLNIVAGLTLCFIAVSPLVKQMISWMFIAGTLMHSGMLYLGVILAQSWAWTFVKLGPPFLLLGLLSIGVAAAIGLKGQVVVDSPELLADDEDVL